MISRLRRNHMAAGYEDPGSFSVDILIPDIDQLVDSKDKIKKIQYAPTINREWKFEEPIDNPEWALQTSFTKNI
jgi:hypothetical protein